MTTILTLCPICSSRCTISIVHDHAYTARRVYCQACLFRSVEYTPSPASSRGRTPRSEDAPAPMRVVNASRDFRSANAPDFSEVPFVTPSRERRDKTILAIGLIGTAFMLFGGLAQMALALGMFR